MLDESYPKRFRAICREVGQRRWRRVIMLGDDLFEGPYTLKACLAQAGVMVLAPGPQDRVWLQSLVSETKSGAQPGDASLTRLTALLADGMEHGVDAFVATDTAMVTLVKACIPDAQILDVAPQESD